jgi:TRAP-type C4-dicarboxylate transport system substrate-binding protein
MEFSSDFRRQAISLGVFCALLTAAGLASAQNKVTLTSSTWVPMDHGLTVAQKEWCDDVAKATEKRVTCNLLAKPVAPPGKTFDAIRDGLADVSFDVHGYSPGRFKLTEMVELPFMGDSAEATSVAYEKVYEKYMAKLGEHKGLHVLTVFTHGPGLILNTKRPIKSMSDLDGLKIRVGGGMVNEIGKAMGVNVTLKPAPQSYELLSSGVMDGVFFPAESVKSFKLEKLIKYRTSFPGGLYNTSFAIVMNQDAWAKIGKKDQEAINKLSGVALAQRIGRAWDRADREGMAVMQANNVEGISASKAFVDEVKSKTSGLEEKWIKEAKERGLTNAAEVLKEYRALLAAN